MGKNRVFFPQGALDQWLGESKVELANDHLVIKAEGRKYRIIEAVRVLVEVTGAEDVHELEGKVKTVPFVTELGAELLGSSMIIGDNAYDVVPGFVGAPVGTFDEHRAASSAEQQSPKSEEELLAQYLMRNLE